MKIISFVFLLSILWFSCTQRTRQEEKPIILVSILPQKTFVEKIAGEDFTVSILIPHGANPTTYTLLPTQMADISNALAWFRMGYIGFELSFADKIIQANPSMKVVDLSEGLDLIAHGRDNSGRLTGADPHIWLSPALVKKMASEMRDQLIGISPAKTKEYEENYQKFIREIDDTDVEIRKLLNGFEGRQFITFHPSLSYFARDYGLVQLSIQQGGKEPTPSHIARLVDAAESEKIKTIYIQSDFDRENARMFANEIKGDVVQVWPLNPEWSENLVNMAQMLRDNFQ